jgi:leukotriene-A4 hydrolase
VKRLLLVAIACGACAPSTSTPPATGRDPHSHAEPDRVAVSHLQLTLAVDFARRVMAGTSRLTIVRHDKSAPLVLDDDGLTIHEVHACGGAVLPYALGAIAPGGQALTVQLPDPTIQCVEIRYETKPDAAALLWVEPSGTTSGDQPMLFTQSQAILARTWIPLQDSPSVRFTYDATVTVPANAKAVMSAENPIAIGDDGAWHFKQPHPIPSYLMALAVGHLVFRSIGPRSGVYAEPPIDKDAAYEFEEVEAMITAAETLYGPYRWGRYDMLVLPPSFPMGGMENPNLTFLTPTVITGDRALVSLIAHELAHSWSGNLATNSTWNDTWLNEGTTTYVENRIMEQLRGREYADMLWYLTGRAIARTIAADSPLSPTTRLAHACGSDVEAENIPTDLAYDKGALFLRTLEVTYGREVFDRFLRGWFDRHAFQAVDSRMFMAEATQHLGTKVNLGAWLYGTGLPADAAPTTSTRATMLEAAATALGTAGTVPDASSWTSMDWSVFVRALPRPLSREHLDLLDAKYQLTSTKNAEIAMYWLPRVVEADAQDRSSAVQAFLGTVGRRRMVVPLYATMVDKGAFWKGLAGSTFEQVKARYHPITRETVAKIIAGEN